MFCLLYKNISPANKSLFVPALCSALRQVPHSNRDDPPRVVLEGEVGVRHLQYHADSVRQICSVETENWAFLTHFGREWQSLCLFRNNGEYLGIAWAASTLSALFYGCSQDSPFRRPKRPGTRDRMLWGHRSSQRRLSRLEAERRRVDLKQGRSWRTGHLGRAGPGDVNYLIMPSWRSLESLVMQAISQDRIIKN